MARRSKISRRPSPSLAISLLALFVALGGTTYAATDGNFILGRANTATTPSSLSANTASGPTLSLTNNGGKPAAAFITDVSKAPFTVNRAVRVANLNADKIDGIDSTAFLGVGAKAADSELLDGRDSTSFARAEALQWHYIGDSGEPAFQSGWANYDPAPNHTDAIWQHAAYAKDQFGVIHLRGLVKNGTIGATIFTLPGPSLCPWFFHTFPVISNNALGRVTVTYETPSCNVFAEVGSNAWVALDGISFSDAFHDVPPIAGSGSTPSSRTPPPGGAPLLPTGSGQ